MVKYLYAYMEKCTGCKLCAIACSLKKFNECNPKRGGIGIVRDEFERYEVQFLCLQCEEPECISVCPKNALYKENNVVKLDKEKCIGCRLCVISCPYGGISSYKGEIVKCDLCYPEEPLCIKFCAPRALVYEEETVELAQRRKELAEKLFRRGV